MKLKLKLPILMIFSILIWTQSTSQALQDFNKFSLEISGGIHIPITPTDHMDNESAYIGFNQFEASGRYMISPEFGLKAYLGFNRFDGGEVGTGEHEGVDLYNSFTRIGVEGVVNLGDLLNFNPRFSKKNAILFQAGAGLTFSKSATSEGNVDRMGIITVGVKPQRKINERFALFLDLSYVVNLRQHQSFSGVRFDDMNSVVGGFSNLGIGIAFYLGSNKEHADWF